MEVCASKIPCRRFLCGWLPRESWRTEGSGDQKTPGKVDHAASLTRERLLNVWDLWLLWSIQEAKTLQFHQKEFKIEKKKNQKKVVALYSCLAEHYTAV